MSKEAREEQRLAKLKQQQSGLIKKPVSKLLKQKEKADDTGLGLVELSSVNHVVQSGEHSIFMVVEEGESSPNQQNPLA